MDKKPGTSSCHLHKLIHGLSLRAVSQKFLEQPGIRSVAQVVSLEMEAQELQILFRDLPLSYLQTFRSFLYLAGKADKESIASKRVQMNCLAQLFAPPLKLLSLLIMSESYV